VATCGTFGLSLSALTLAAIYDHFERRSRGELTPFGRLADGFGQPSNVTTTTTVTDKSVKTTNLKGLNVSSNPTKNVVSNVPSPKSSPSSHGSKSSGTPRDHCRCNVK
jgi:hypothetical protein